MDRLEQQMAFIAEIDKSKQVFRRNWIMDHSRHENDAEHSWHMAVMAMLLMEYGDAEHYDLLHVMKMVLIHDLVEIDAGDTFCYDEAGYLDKPEREQKAAERIFGLLPKDQREEFYALWREFEAMETPEAKFAAALDRMSPVLCNFHTDGGTWVEHDITYEQVIKRNAPIEKFSPKLWEYFQKKLLEYKEKGYFKES